MSRASIKIFIAILMLPSLCNASGLEGFMRGFAQSAEYITSDPYYKKRKMLEEANKKLTELQNIEQKQNIILVNRDAEMKELDSLLREFYATK